MKNKVLLVIYLGIIAVTLTSVGIWQMVEEFRFVWLWVTALGICSMTIASTIFNRLQFGEIEVEVEGED